MKQQIESVLAEVFKNHADRRTDVYKLQVEWAAADTVKLAGRVLSPESLEATRKAVSAKFPAAKLDTASVKVLRAKPGVMHTVATTLTDLHVEPSFLSEMYLQVVNGQPLEVLDEHTDGKWVFVRQPDGYMGWAYKSYLVEGAPKEDATHVISGHVGILCREPGGTPVSRLLCGTKLRVTEEKNDWSRVEPAGPILTPGWVLSKSLRSLNGLAPGDGSQIVADARTFTGTYYLWGGNSPFGIDCSGLAGLTHRLSGVILPRDADQQFRAGKVVEGDPRPGDLLFFHSETNKEKITHVGISTGGYDIIHSSRSRNGVYEENVRTSENLNKVYAGARTFIR